MSRFTIRSNYRKYLQKNTIIFTITQEQRKSDRKYLRWDLRSTWIIVNIIVNFWSKFTIIWAERKSHRKYLRWDLRSTRIIVNIYDNSSVNIYDNDLWLLTHILTTVNTGQSWGQAAKWKPRNLKKKLGLNDSAELCLQLHYLHENANICMKIQTM